jgi:hypothetical protein
MSDLSVPTVQLEAEVRFVDGTTLTGTVYIPTVSAVRAGPMLPQEWINGPPLFFPLRLHHAPSAILVNKRQVLSLCVPTAQGEDDSPWESASLVLRVVAEAGTERFEGEVVIDMPEGQRRLADYLNRPEMFLLLQSGAQQHLIQKDRISRMSEVLET